MSKVWKSITELKKKFFVATVESILLYGCEAWTLTKTMENAFRRYLYQNAQKIPKCALE